MEGDLTEKVRDSIKKKLQNFNFRSNWTYLPEYIMAMVANKTSRERMQTDLTRFLDQHAASFTDWLHGMLDNLEKDATKRIEETKNNLSDVSAVLKGEETSKNSEGEVLTLDVQLQDDQSLLKELHEDTSKESSQKEKESIQSTNRLYSKKAKPVPVNLLEDRQKTVVPEPPNNQQPEKQLPKHVRKSTVKAFKRTATDALMDDANPGIANLLLAKQIVLQSRQTNTHQDIHQISASEKCGNQQEVVPVRAPSPELYFYCTEWKADQDTDLAEPPLEPPVSPQFVVPLDGINNSIDSAAAEKSKKNCRFWPACKNGDNCAFHHPTVPCKLFPKCYKYKCHYVHTKCRYGASCSRRDCHFMHPGKQDFAKRPVVPVLRKAHRSVKLTSTKTGEVCPTPNCTTYHCPYIHPRKCHFGSSCKSKGCPFAHPVFPSRKELKWTVEKENVLSREENCCNLQN